MRHLQSLLIGTTLAATTITGATLAPSAAQAMSLNGSISLTGTPVFGNPKAVNPTNTSLDVTSAKVLQSTGDFANGSFGSLAPTFETLSLTRIDSSIDGEKANYSYGQTTSFIDFGMQDLGDGLKQLTFDLNAGKLTKGTGYNGAMSYAFDTKLTGKFNYGGSSFATGFLSASRVFESTSFQITLEAKEVPEPLTILGTTVALGFGAMFKKRAGKNPKKK
ncbi:MAG: PEP-CTERM sorting domain-containing protein [Microcoleaceae cyanobacterium]